VVSDLLLAQYRVVLLRPCLCQICGRSALEVDVVLKGFARHVIVMKLPFTTALPLAADRCDQFSWNLLATPADMLVVTGEKLLQFDATMRQRVISPQTFVGHE